MTRKPHDTFAKQYLKGLLEPLGATETSHDVFGETQQADIWFVPTATDPDIWQALGLLGQLVAQPCLLEPFRNPAPIVEIRACLMKLFALQAEEQRRARREQRRLRETQLPYLWILTPTASQAVLQGFGAAMHPEHTGVYNLPVHFHAALVVLHQLPVVPETLWLRLLGRGPVQAHAIRELLYLSLTNPLRRPVLEYLVKLQVTLQSRQNLNREQRELAMNLDIVYEQWRQQTLQEGRQEGYQAALCAEITDLLEVRFGPLDSQLVAVVEQILQWPQRDRTCLLLQLPTLSREALIAQVERGDRDSC